jgi:hypothetical protein
LFVKKAVTITAEWKYTSYFSKDTNFKRCIDFPKFKQEIYIKIAIETYLFQSISNQFFCGDTV